MLRTKKAPSFQTEDYTGATCYCQPRPKAVRKRLASARMLASPPTGIERHISNFELTNFVEAVKKRDRPMRDLVTGEGRISRVLAFSPFCRLEH